MKVGTLTFHKTSNYGATLQAYALQRYLIKLGCDTEIIDYISNSNIVKSQNNRFNKVEKYLKHPIKELKARNRSKLIIQKFQSFRNDNLILSENKYNSDVVIEKTPPDYDYYVVGSDQVWNTDLSNKSKAFYLHFVKEGKKLSYAASFGKDNLNECEESYIIHYLKSFDSISVREKHHSDMLYNEYNISAKVTLDPVFLLDKYEWEQISKPINKLPQKYVLVYVLEYSVELFECAKKKARELNCKLIYISLIKEKIKGKQLHNIGPSEFLYAFLNATYICTNSFHGTAFSIIFNKSFSIVKHSTRNSRIDNILEITDLKYRYYQGVNSNKKIINYDIVNKKLDKAIDDSKRFIINSLSINK